MLKLAPPTGIRGKVKKFLAREGRRLLDDFGAPNGKVLLLRVIVYGAVGAFTTGVLLGLVWLYYAAGMAAFVAAAVAIIVIAIWMQRRAPVYVGGADDWLFMGERLPPPGNPALPPATWALQQVVSCPASNGRAANVAATAESDPKPTCKVLRLSCF
jgi:hypothetical protein